MLIENNSENVKKIKKLHSTLKLPDNFMYKSTVITPNNLYSHAGQVNRMLIFRLNSLSPGKCY